MTGVPLDIPDDVVRAAQDAWDNNADFRPPVGVLHHVARAAVEAWERHRAQGEPMQAKALGAISEIEALAADVARIKAALRENKIIHDNRLHDSPCPLVTDVFASPDDCTCWLSR